MSLLLVTASLLIASTAGALWFIAGATALAYMGLFLLVCTPGLPVGLALFGRRHPVGWIAGLPLGYAITTLAWWLAIVSGIPTLTAFVSLWVAASIASWASMRWVSSPLIVLPRWSRREAMALCVLLLMVPAMVGPAFTRLGSRDAEGNRLYRAYFTADFVWHTALAGELAKHERHPRNPFLADQPVHYYWTYFRVPATVSAETGIDVQTALKLNAFATAFLFIAAIYVAAWSALPAWPLASAVGVALAFLAPSIEGLASIAELMRRGQALSGLRDLNIDAVASWAFGGIRIDNLPRAMWYNPQHSFSCAFGLLPVPVAIHGGVRARPWAILLAGCALGASLAFNPLLGVSFCLVYGVTILADVVRQGAPLKSLLRHVLSVAPVMLALAWCTYNEVGEGAGSALALGYTGLARNATLLNLSLQLGPIFIPIAVGLWPRPSEPLGPIWPAVTGVILGLVLMHFVALTVNPAWVGFRGGQIFLVLAPAIVTRGVVRLWSGGRRRAGVLMTLAVTALGLPTSVIDTYNTQDVTNRNMSPGGEFPWTIVISPDEQEALEWVRTQTPTAAVVQAEPMARARNTWSYIPSFGQRRSATGNALPLLPVPEYAERNERVRQIYAAQDARRAWEEARALGIDFLYVGVVERTAYPAARKFDEHPELFARAFGNAEATVYAIRGPG